MVAKKKNILTKLVSDFKEHTSKASKKGNNPIKKIYYAIVF
jgi:hypothetical protein